MSLTVEARRKIRRAVSLGGGAMLLVLMLLHFLHPRADFPNFSPWMDYAKYTDEGWYGSAAVAYFIRGGWYVAGDFNPAVALPVWPLIEWVLFHFTGVSLTAVRVLAVVLFCANVGLTYALVRSQAERWAALLTALLVTSNAFLFCFSRLAILEPPLVLLMLSAWLLGLKLRQAESARSRFAMLAGMGLLLCAMVLTKTTAVFLIPSVVYLVWHAHRESRRDTLRAAAIVAISAAAPWLVYYGLAVRPHYLEDYRYLFTANMFTQPSTAGGWAMAFWYSIHGALWIDRTLALCAAAFVLASVFLLRRLWQNPLFTACCLGAGGYLFFIGFHNNMQPRYYQVVAFPMAITVGLSLQELLRSRQRWRTPVAWAAGLALAWGIFFNTRQTVWFALHPQYTFVDAAQNLTRYIDEHPNRNRLLLSISGSNIALITGLPAICDDFGTLDLEERIRRYQPGWYAAWNEVDPGTLEELRTQFKLDQVANFPAYDDEDRNNLILYKLTPLEDQQPKARSPRRRRHAPFGEQAGKPAKVRRISE